MAQDVTPDQDVAIVVGNTEVSASSPFPVTVAGGSGLGGPVTIADGADVVEGAKADAAWNGTPGSTTIMAVLKAIYGKVAATLGFSVNAGTTDATTLRVITASDGPLNTNLGTTTDAAVVTDANGSLSGKIRGLVKIFADVWDSTIHGLRLAPQQVSLTDKSSTITSGGVSQQLAASNASRQYLFIQNVSTGDLYFNFNTAAVATQPSVKLSPGQSMTMDRVVDTRAVNIIGATTGQAFTSKEG